MSRSEPRIDPISLVSPQAITERQREVARLIAAGRTNTEIADELGLTLDGAKYHVSALLTRLGLRRREEVAEWYRAHFGPIARVRSLMRGFLALPILGLVGGATVAGGLVVVAALTVVAVRNVVPEEIEPPEYPPFAQVWMIEGLETETQYMTLEWHECSRWRVRLLNEVGDVLNVAHGGTPSEGGCHIPGVWFRPIDSFRDNPNPGHRALGPFEYEFAYIRDCSEVSNPIDPDNPLGPDLCADPGDTFEDRVVVEFDPDTLIPMRYSQYVDDVLSFEHRALSLRLLTPDEMRPLPVSSP